MAIALFYSIDKNEKVSFLSNIMDLLLFKL